jgi:hypothetical protein
MNLDTKIPEGITKENYDTHNFTEDYALFSKCTKCGLKISHTFSTTKIPDSESYIMDTVSKKSYAKWDVSCDEYSIKEIIE